MTTLSYSSCFVGKKAEEQDSTVCSDDDRSLLWSSTSTCQREVVPNSTQTELYSSTCCVWNHTFTRWPEQSLTEQMAPYDHHSPLHIVYSYLLSPLFSEASFCVTWPSLQNTLEKRMHVEEKIIKRVSVSSHREEIRNAYIRQYIPSTRVSKKQRYSNMWYDRRAAAMI